MEIVIKIPEDAYRQIRNWGVPTDELRRKIYDIIDNGTPLPEKHGRLIDADELYGDFIDGTEGYDCNTWNRIEIGDIIEDAPTIIEGSDKE